MTSTSPRPPVNTGIAVVIATYKRPHLLERALDSIATQSLLPAEIFVVDDCSGDNSGQVVEGWSKRTGIDVRFITMPQNSGVGAVRNVAMRQSTAPYIAFLDSDDAYLPNALETLVTPLLHHPNAVVSFADAQVINAAGQAEAMLMSRALSSETDCIAVGDGHTGLFGLIDPSSTLLLTSMIPTCSAIFRRNAAENIGFMPEYRYGEDWLFWLKMSGQGDFLCQFTTTSLVHRQNDNLTGPRHHAASANMVLRAFYGLQTGDFGINLNPRQQAKLKDAIIMEIPNWRYQNSRGGICHYLKSLRSAEGKKSGGALHHLVNDPKSLLRAMASGW